MSFKIAFKKSVSRDLRKIDKDQAERILRKIEEELPDKADSFPALTGKFAGLRKFRVGDYRVIYTLIQDTVLILRISHRRESYR
ncbi:MAG: type II toxin-antitoxin system RelE/ParE family toxin [Desulfobacteraceae bacterium]